MACAHCEQLREEIAYLKSELGIGKDRPATLREKFGFTPAEAAIVDRLYAAKGRVVDHVTLESTLPTENDERNYKIVSVYICRIRHRIGKGAIRSSWGDGYRMTPEGLQIVAAAL